MTALAPSHVLSQEVAALRPVVRAVIACVLGETKGHPDVEDGTSETLRRALEGQARLREGGAAAVAPRDRAPRGARRAEAAQARPALLERHAGRRGEIEAAVDRLIDPGPAPDERAASTQRARQIAGAMAGLSDSQREAMMLFHVEGQDYKQIAERLGVPMGTVATWLARGRRALADALGETVKQ